LEEHKRRERAQAIGLFRYQLICPAWDTALSSHFHRLESTPSHTE
jgi:hypothetical protein